MGRVPGGIGRCGALGGASEIHEAMNLSLARLRERLLGMAPEEATFARRGFRAGEAAVRERLELLGSAFLQGYHLAVRVGDPAALGPRLNAVGPEVRGFAFEGAAMGLALLDHLTPWRRNRWQAFLAGPGRPHTYMVHVGAGWALARLPWARHHPERPLARLDPLLRWLTVDGYGFHEGYFHWRRTVERQAIPAGLFGYGRRAFDQGLGRSLWFVGGADVAWIPATIATFPPGRRADLWSGVGLACAYAGGVERAGLEALLARAGPYAPHLAQGAAFAAKARQRAGNPSPHTELACRVLCGLGADAAGAVTDAAVEGLPPDGTAPAYEIWRHRIRAHFVPQAVTS